MIFVWKQVWFERQSTSIDFLCFTRAPVILSSDIRCQRWNLKSHSVQKLNRIFHIISTVAPAVLNNPSRINRKALALSPLHCYSFYFMFDEVFLNFRAKLKTKRKLYLCTDAVVFIMNSKSFFGMRKQQNVLSNLEKLWNNLTVKMHCSQRI